VHAGDSGHDPIGLAQSLDKPRRHDDLAAMVVKELLGLIQPLRGQEDVLAVLQRQPPAAEVPDREADVVAQHRADPGDDADRDHVQLARPRVQRGRDENRLAGNRDAEVLDQDQAAHREVTVVVEDRRERTEDPRQLRRAHGVSG
jgi:hypothetical protein